MTDITEYDEPNILFFQGVFPDKYDIDTMFTNKIMDSLRISGSVESNINDEINAYTMFDKIPAVFLTMDTWPASTNIQCWWHSGTFKCPPIFIPINISSNGDMTPYGNFCSFPCAAAHIDTFMPIKVRRERHRMLKILHEKMTGLCIEYIHRAPVPFTMLQYGGGTDSGDTFVKKLTVLSQSMKTHTNPQ
jgi:hypothetical protein